MQHKTSLALSTETITVSGGFGIQSARVDNFSNQWLQVQGQFQFVAPYTYGEIFPMGGAGSLSIGPGIPGGAHAQDVSITGERYAVTIYDVGIPPQPGYLGVIKLDTFVPQNAFTFKVGSAAGQSDIVKVGAIANLISQAGGARRVLIKNESSSTGKVWVAILAQVIVANNFAVELAPGDAIAVAYPWLSGSALNFPTNPPSGQGWLQLWFDDATSTADIMVLCGP